MTDRVRIATADDLQPGACEFVRIDGRKVGVTNRRGDCYAVQDQCPHQHGSVCSGLTRGQLVADWGGVGGRVTETIDEERPAISCPKHGWEYDPRTGQHLGDPSISFDTYGVVVADEVVYVSIAPAGSSRSE